MSARGLGDAHNFGRRVSMRAGRVHKPRTLLWEWLMLSAKSPLRRTLDALAEDAGLGGDTFGFLPDLAFSSPAAHGGGDVQRIALTPLPAPSPALRNERRRALATVVGRSLALWSWLGVSDLHWENLVLGVSKQGRVVFSPLDVETIFADMSLPTETKLLPDADPETAAICRHAAGVRRVLPALGKPVDAAHVVAMVGAYRATLELLDDRAHVIAGVLARVPALRRAPIRVLLRGTEAYVRARSEPIWPPLLDAEAEQLARGDIPYFFRIYGRRGIHYYAERSLRRLDRIPLQGDVPKLDPLLRLSRGLRSPNRKKLRDEGAFALLGAFDHGALAGRHETDDLAVTFGARTLVVERRTRSGAREVLQSKRDLSAFVGSVYLPCRCGEVRSVFVPPVTTCETARATL